MTNRFLIHSYSLQGRRDSNEDKHYGYSEKKVK